MTSTGIIFKTEKDGYDKEQVDKYISRLSEEYQKAYNEYQNISSINSTLLDECSRMKRQEELGMDPDVIAKTLLSAETMAQKTIDDAHFEAAALKLEAQQLLDGAKAESEQAKEFSQKIVNDAKIQAAKMIFRTRRNIEQVRKAMELAMGGMDKLLAFTTTKKEPAVSA
ncbi:MAG: DivIVA domain-containing protein [Synergistaceae bacterium]|nr:DivIVA domain-containing protein [Synergistaceae bacterium]